MERHAIDEEKAFQMLRDHARTRQSVLVDAAESIVDGTELTEVP
jgi:AmiR/NasT family two-component response regulator